MKTKLAILTALGFSIAASFGAVYNVTTGALATSNGIASTGLQSNVGGLVDNAANTYIGYQGNGIVAYGIFTTSDALITGADSLSSIVGAFVQFGASGAFNAAGPTGQRGVFTRNTSATVAGSAFDNKNIYVLAGNGTTFANSTELLVLRSTTLFTAAQDAIPTAQLVSITPSTASLLFGVNLSNVKTTTTDASVTPGWGTAVAIPEPSAAILGAIGALGLLRRRRI